MTWVFKFLSFIHVQTDVTIPPLSSSIIFKDPSFSLSFFKQVSALRRIEPTSLSWLLSLLTSCSNAAATGTCQGTPSQLSRDDNLINYNATTCLGLFPSHFPLARNSVLHSSLKTRTILNPRPEASVLLGNSLERQILRPCPKHAESEFLVGGPRDLWFISSPGDSEAC